MNSAGNALQYELLLLLIISSCVIWGTEVDFLTDLTNSPGS
jgi:hypothetical protein